MRLKKVWQSVKSGRKATSASIPDILSSAGLGGVISAVLTWSVIAKEPVPVFDSVRSYVLIAALFTLFPLIGSIIFSKYLTGHEEKYKWATVSFFPFIFALSIYNIIVSFAGLYKFLGIIDTSDNKCCIYDGASSIYFSIVTWTTLGYGDFKPSEQSRFVAATEAILGYVMMAALIAIFARVFGWFLAPKAPPVE